MQLEAAQQQQQQLAGHDSTLATQLEQAHVEMNEAMAMLAAERKRNEELERQRESAAEVRSACSAALPPCLRSPGSTRLLPCRRVSPVPLTARRMEGRRDAPVASACLLTLHCAVLCRLLPARACRSPSC